jgi:hypothetical protein
VARVFDLNARVRDLRHTDFVHDANDAAIADHFQVEGQGGFTAAAPVHSFAHAGAHGIDADQGLSTRRTILVHRLKEQELASFQHRELNGANDRADNFGEHHSDCRIAELPN